MPKCRAAFTGSIYSSHKNCDCGGTYIREPHPNYGILAPFCEDCGEIAAGFVLKRKEGSKVCHSISYDRQGQALSSMDHVIRVAQQISYEMARGEFCSSNYKRRAVGTLAESVESFINRVVLQQYPQKDESPEYRYLKERMAPYFEDVGIFAACDVHLNFFIHDMRLIKSHQREYARKLWNQVMELARPQI